MSSKEATISEIEITIIQNNINLKRISKSSFIKTAKFNQILSQIELLNNILLKSIENDLCDRYLKIFIDEFFQLRFSLCIGISSKLIFEIIHPMAKLEEYLCTKHNKNWF